MSNVVKHPKTHLDHTFEAPPKPMLLDAVRARIRRLNYSTRTEATYVDWVRRFVLFHGKRHLRNLGATEIEAFPTHRAADAKVAAETRRQTRSVRLFLYRQMPDIAFARLSGIVSAR